MSAVLRLPEVLTGMEEATLTSWHVAVGEAVRVGQPVADLETEKAMVEYVADADGVVADLLAEVAQPIKVGTPLVLLATGGESPDDARRGQDDGGSPGTAAAPAAAPTTRNGRPRGSGTDPSSVERRPVSPLVRRLAAERGVDLARLEGTGPGGRIVRRDLDRFALAERPSAPVPEPEAAPPPPPVPGSPVPGPPESGTPRDGSTVTAVPHSPMRRAIARRLSASKATVPHFYLTADCRVDALLALRRRLDDELAVNVSINDLVVKAVAGALQEIPEMNAVWTDDAILRYAEVDVAVAVALEDGLVTPVVRNVAARSIRDVSAAIKDAAARARSRSLQQAELEGGTFTVSNLGMFGTRQFAAIVSPPHSGILAVGAVSERPVVESGRVVAGRVMTVTLSGDHRVVDGATGARWLAAFVRRIENPLSILV